MKICKSFFVFVIFALALEQICFAQQPQQAQPLNASVSDMGTTFSTYPAPLCSGCVETELGFLSLQSGRFAPAVLTIAPFSSRTDINILVNALASDASSGQRISHFGNRFDFVVRQQVLEKNGFVVSVVPRGSVFVRDTSGGRLGGLISVQYNKGKNTEVVNFSLTRALNASVLNPNSDYQSMFDYSRTLGAKGASFYLGFMHEVSTGIPQSLNTEAGLILPFRNGQVELAAERLNLNTRPVWQYQARVIVNWGKILGHR